MKKSNQNINLSRLNNSEANSPIGGRGAFSLNADNQNIYKPNPVGSEANSPIGGRGAVPLLTLIGAGPGDPDLITLKAIKALKVADVILYDALIANELLDYCKPEAIKIFVGKRAGGECVSQEYINYLIVQNALMYGHVVRLKGGDSMVFGRAQEEIDAAKAHGIEVNIIPGISSALAAPASVGLPLTSRGVADSFWVITGTKSDHSLSKDLKLAIQSKATVVMLMAMNKAQQIADWYINEGLAEMPVIIISKATTSDQKSASGIVADLPNIIAENELENPAVMVIGEVVKSPLAPRGEMLREANLFFGK